MYVARVHQRRGVGSSYPRILTGEKEKFSRAKVAYWPRRSRNINSSAEVMGDVRNIFAVNGVWERCERCGGSGTGGSTLVGNMLSRDIGAESAMKRMIKLRPGALYLSDCGPDFGFGSGSGSAG